jgi:DNA (cytosine-5)-methyltransferase 1
MKHGSLFSGIGGFDLAAEWMGWENVFHCEWNPFGQRVLKHYWPNAELFTDITKSDFTKYANQIDILTGGFPCQPYSSAGKRLGKEDERHLWPQMLRAIREIAPRFVVGENVRGLTNWNGGLVFNEVCTDLENLGYQVAPFIIPASAINAPHQRERVWFVANRDHGSGSKHEFRSGGNVPQKWIDRSGVTTNAERIRLEHTEETRNVQKGSRKTQSQRSKFTKSIKTNGGNGNVAHTNGNGCNQRNGEHEKHSSETGFDAFDDFNANDQRGNDSNASGSRLERSAREGIQGTINGFALENWDKFPTQSPICGGNDGLPTELDGITFPKWRNESIKAYGNAIVPQVVYEIFKAIENYENF